MNWVGSSVREVGMGVLGLLKTRWWERAECKYRVGAWKRRRKRAASYLKRRQILLRHPNCRCRMIDHRRPRNERLGLTESCQRLQSGCHVDNELKNDRSGLGRDRGGIKIEIGEASSESIVRNMKNETYWRRRDQRRARAFDELGEYFVEFH